MHQNSMESISFVILWTLIAGLVYTNVAIGWGCAFIVGRLLYILGYRFRIIARLPGWYTGFISSLVLFAYAIASAVYLVQNQTTTAEVTTA